jgi:HSP20 family molecular chaperone IbpA
MATNLKFTLGLFLSVGEPNFGTAKLNKSGAITSLYNHSNPHTAALMAQLFVGTRIDNCGTEEKKEMDNKLNLPQELITGIDVVNTLNGGTSEPDILKEKFPTYHRITVKIPGIDAENIKIEINNNELMIYYFIVILSQGKDLKYPKMVYKRAIPYYVDITNIAATEKENSMIVHMPFNELANGYHRDVSTTK